MRAWSEYLQLPDFLEYTRRYMLTDEMRELIIKHMEILDGDRVLEAGCGTGYLSRYLMQGRRGLDITGIDNDPGFIKRARELAKTLAPEKPGNQAPMGTLCFQGADARSLPFGDDCFNRVVSHTFLTSTANPKRVMEEMFRVVKPGGTISSLTSMSMTPAVMDPGQYPPECRWAGRYQDLSVKVWNLYESMNPISRYMDAKDSSKIPRLFADCGLKEISLFPVGTVFSFSNAALHEKDREEYVKLSFQAELSKLDHFLRLEGWQQYMTDRETEEYKSLLLEKRDYLLSHPRENSVFEWSGSSGILVTGRKEL